MGYTFALSCLAKLTDKEFAAIPPCAREAVTHREPSQIACKEQAWLYELCKDISPTKEECGTTLRPWPRYIPELAIRKSYEAILIKTWDAWRSEPVMLKVPLPLSVHDGKELLQHEAGRKEEKSIIRGANELRRVVENLYKRKKHVQKTEVKAKFDREKEEAKAKQQKELDESSLYKRFHRSFIVQEQLHRKGNRSDPNKIYGYIPKTYEFGFAPKCFETMEFIDGETYINYIRSHNDGEIFSLFLKLVIFIEKVVHAMGVAHCDLAPRNVLVKGNHIVLLDFGIVKVPNMGEITLPTTQLGSLAYASSSQLEDSRSRSFQDDIFALGRILWVTITRREPLMESILADVGDDGKISADADMIASLFDLYSVPDKFKGIYQNTQKGTYLDIQDFRSDLESLFFVSDKADSCQKPCDALLDLYKIVEILTKKGK